MILYLIHNSKFFLDANITSFIDSAVTDPQYATIDQLHEVVPVSVKIPKVLPITVEDLGKYVLNCHNNGDEELKNQYQVNCWHDTSAIVTNWYSHAVFI